MPTLPGPRGGSRQTRALPADPLIGAFLRRQTSWSDAYQRNAVSIYNRYTAWLTDRGVDLTEADGGDCAAFLNDRRAGTTGLTAANGQPVPPVSGATLHKDWQLLRWLYQWLSAQGELPDRKRRTRGGKTAWVPAHDDGPMEGISAPTDLEPDPQRVRQISERDYRRLLGSFDKRKVLDCRNAAVVSLMFRQGVRMSEVARCDLARYDAAAGTLMVYGKSKAWRPVTLSAETRDLIDRYLRRRAADERARGLEPSPALFTASLGCADPDARLRPDAIAAVLERRSEKLGIDVSAHQFRRAATISAKRRGIQETEIARQLGWSESSAKRMIPRYTQADADALTAEAWRAADPTAHPRRARAHLRVVGQ